MVAASFGQGVWHFVANYQTVRGRRGQPRRPRGNGRKNSPRARKGRNRIHQRRRIRRALGEEAALRRACGVVASTELRDHGEQSGNVVAVSGNRLTIRFDKAGEKRVVDSFVEGV